MEPYYEYEQNLSYEHRASLSPFFGEQEKIMPRSHKGFWIMSGIMQCLLLLLSLFYFLFLIDNFLVIGVDFLAINAFFFLLAFVFTKRLTRNRKIIYVCFVFVSTLALFFCTLIALLSHGTGGSIVLWGVALLIDGALYLLLRSMPAITI